MNWNPGPSIRRAKIIPGTGKKIVVSRRELSLRPHSSLFALGSEAAPVPEHPGFQGLLGTRACFSAPCQDLPYQLLATASTIRARPTRSFRSITSAGECEYRSGHPIAASGTP